MRQITMAIDGMSCDGCVRAVARAIDVVPGARVDAVAVGRATVRYDPSRTSPAAIAQAIRAAGPRRRVQSSRPLPEYRSRVRVAAVGEDPETAVADPVKDGRPPERLFRNSDVAIAGGCELQSKNL